MVDTSFRRLEVFVVAVEAGSFQACADRLDISQASVSNHIHALELQLGRQLFARRRGATASLTEEGGRTYEVAKNLIESACSLFSGDAQHPAEKSRRRIKLAMHGYIASVLSRTLALFAAKHPETNLVVETAPFENMVENLGLGKLDLGYFLSMGEVVEVPSKLVWKEPVGLYVDVNHPLASLRAVPVEVLRRYPLAVLPPGAHLRRLVVGALQRIGITNYSSAFEGEEFTAACEAISMGMGYCCLFDRSVARLAVTYPNLRRLPVDVSGIEVRVSVHARNRLDPLIKKLTDTIAAEAQARAVEEKRGNAVAA